MDIFDEGFVHFFAFQQELTIGIEPITSSLQVRLPQFFVRLTQLGECRSYKSEVAGSSPASDILAPWSNG